MTTPDQENEFQALLRQHADGVEVSGDFAPCAIAGHDESNPASGSVSSSPTRYVVGRATSCFLNCSSVSRDAYPVRP